MNHYLQPYSPYPMYPPYGLPPMYHQPMYAPYGPPPLTQPFRPPHPQWGDALPSTQRLDFAQLTEDPIVWCVSLKCSESIALDQSFVQFGTGALLCRNCDPDFSPDLAALPEPDTDDSASDEDGEKEKEKEKEPEEGDEDKDVEENEKDDGGPGYWKTPRTFSALAVASWNTEPPEKGLTKLKRNGAIRWPPKRLQPIVQTTSPGFIPISTCRRSPVAIEGSDMVGVRYIAVLEWLPRIKWDRQGRMQMRLTAGELSVQKVLPVPLQGKERLVMVLHEARRVDSFIPLSSVHLLAVCQDSKCKANGWRGFIGIYCDTMTEAEIEEEVERALQQAKSDLKRQAQSLEKSGFRPIREPTAPPLPQGPTEEEEEKDGDDEDSDEQP